MKGNHKNPQPVIPVYNRKIARNRLKKALRSSDIDFSEDGTIFAGFRNVGRFEVTANET